MKISHCFEYEKPEQINAVLDCCVVLRKTYRGRVVDSFVKVLAGDNQLLKQGYQR